MLNTPIARYLREEITLEEYKYLQGADRLVNNSLARDGEFVTFTGDTR